MDKVLKETTNYSAEDARFMEMYRAQNEVYNVG